MNSYNENLQTAVNTEVSQLETEHNKVKAQKNAAQFTLYYAEGGVMTAQDKLDDVVADYDSAKDITSQGILNDNIATNLNATAKMAESNVASTITNSATAAANVQIAAKAISKLASDIGSVFNIVSAADYGTDIYNLSKQANNLIGTTAYNAELASQHAMEASSQSSEIIAKTVGDQSALVKTEVENLLNVTKAQFQKIAASREAANKKLGDSRKKEKAAEGILKDCDVEYNALNEAYENTNEELNFKLDVNEVKDTGFNMSFNGYEVPFKDAEGNPVIDPAVAQYCVIITKSSLKNQFTVAQAEDLMDKPLRFKSVKPQKTGTNYSIDFNLNDQDSDGNTLVLGQEYVAFLFIEFSQPYKKLVNNFSDLLSVASDSFTMKTNMPSVSGIELSSDLKEVTFTSAYDDPSKVEYRCILLQLDKKTTDDFLVGSNVAKLEDKIFVTDIQNNIESNNKEIKALEEKITKLDGNLDQNKKNQKEEGITKNRLDSLKKYQKGLEDQISDAKQKIAILKKENDNLSDQIKDNQAMLKSESDLPSQDSQTPGFYFNKQIAEQIKAGSYEPGTAKKGSTDYTATIKDSTTDNFGNEIRPNEKYMAVVLAVPNVEASELSKYESTLTYPEKEKSTK